MAIKIQNSTIIDDSRNIVNAGVTTVTSVSIGNTQVISSSRQLQNIASLDATTTATIESAIANAPNTFTDLNVTGISTLGVTSATNLTAQQLNVSGVSTISVNSSTDALRITQTGSGNALVVEDSANPDTTPFVVKGDGSVGIGTTNPGTTLDVVGRAQIGGTGISDALYIRRVSDNTTGITFGYPSTNSNSELKLAHNSGGGNFTIHLNGTGGEQGNAFNEKFRFTSAAQLGIGRSNPSAELDVFGGANFTNRVLIGSATSTGTATQRLQVNGGAYVSDYVGIGTTNPGEKLQVDGNIRVGVSTTSNYIAFRGTTGDDQSLYNHTYIGERIWGGTESSELLLFKGNDATTSSGPDRIRLAASQVRIDTYTTSTNGTFDSVGISTNLINRVVVHSTGEVGIGTDVLTGTASQRLQVGSASTPGGAYISGNLGIGTTNPTSKLHVVGDTYISGILTATDINSASDIRLKTNIKPFENTLEKIIQINGVSFNWIDSNAKSGGIIAQDVEKVFPELVNDGDHKTVNYNGLIGVLIESIKELKQEVEDLKSRLSET